MNLYYLEPGTWNHHHWFKAKFRHGSEFFQSTIAFIAADVKLRLQSSSFIKGCSMAFALACLVNTVFSYNPMHCQFGTPNVTNRR